MVDSRLFLPIALKLAPQVPRPCVVESWATARIWIGTTTVLGASPIEADSGCETLDVGSHFAPTSRWGKCTQHFGCA